MWPFRKKSTTPSGPVVSVKRTGRVVSVKVGDRVRVAVETIGGDVDYYFVQSTALKIGDDVTEGASIND